MKDIVLKKREILTIGLMLFALFFGAGNMIFPPLLGQLAGSNVWIAILGFLLTGVGLPLLGIIAIAYSGGNLQLIANRVNPLFGFIFTLTLYMAIGPFFGIPRTATTAYEIGVVPFLAAELNGNISLMVYTMIFFLITYLLSLNPSKLVDRIGKYLTPVLLVVIAFLVGKALLSPMGSLQTPAESYVHSPFFTGFIEGYLTMDTIAALVFGIVIIHSVMEKGVTNRISLLKTCTIAGLIAASGLAIVYVSLAYLGATSVEAIGYAENGGIILSTSASYLLGSVGTSILSIAITFACLTTAVGLVSACAKYLTTLTNKISYKSFVALLTIFSLGVANIGLTQLIAFSVPILIIIYPLAIVLILLSFAHPLIGEKSMIYSLALLATGLISIFDGLNSAGIEFPLLLQFFKEFLPLYEQGIGWVVPAIIGAILGYILSMRK
ncbi:branched-chain amino acid transport system II carrier protein [Bacillus luteolus]|uniref:Branched-chain amino acid transport system carrier protein n=1 Tax=Litchfieldia luteola TaxID=682179 RepID=A0ABR9QIG7_9BACI|nr:branched-chain amino acid transport system II carrier protein [Cytobacillus luteolus]MBE4908285.1 branched-chain amino acid transport system II carrier protein [Cytobacillus luteolus]MBP1943071.1 LIVCS family branched-chain amino acid:cation transporter [Cytobacillus luteolus]